ncbi:MAG: ribosome biogenesis GTPase Der [Acidobacteriota bacterium]
MTTTRSRGRLPSVAIVGRPNVGKSTLFNRLLGSREAIVLNFPGVTRDRIERIWRPGDRVVELTDTGGLVPEGGDELVREVTRQAMQAAREADVVVFVLDGRSGVTPLDEAIAEILRPLGRRVVLVVNKIDVEQHQPLTLDAWRLGLGDPIPVSAEHARGVQEVVDAVLALLPARSPAEDEPGGDDSGALPDPHDELHVAIVGRPNVGKSSLVNRLCGEERVAVSTRPGTTRDVVDVRIVRDGRRFCLVDTAGIRRRARVETRDESVGILLTRRRLARCHGAILLIDAGEGVTSQDQAIAGEIRESGRPVVIAYNKWDLVEDPDRRRAELDEQAFRRLGFLGRAPRMSVSARTGQRAFRVLDRLVPLVETASTRVPTPALNRFLDGVLRQQAAAGGDTPRLLYITQTGVLPPRFVVFCRSPAEIRKSFRTFFEHRLAEAFGLTEVPLAVTFRASKRR